MTEINWNFGILKKEQYQDVHRFVHQESKEWAKSLNKPIYFEDEDDHPYHCSIATVAAYYTILHRQKEEDEFIIRFGVKVPKEPIIQMGKEIPAE